MPTSVLWLAELLALLLLAHRTAAWVKEPDNSTVPADLVLDLFPGNHSAALVSMYRVVDVHTFVGVYITQIRMHNSPVSSWAFDKQ